MKVLLLGLQGVGKTTYLCGISIAEKSLHEYNAHNIYISSENPYLADMTTKSKAGIAPQATRAEAPYRFYLSVKDASRISKREITHIDFIDTRGGLFNSMTYENFDPKSFDMKLKDGDGVGIIVFVSADDLRRCLRYIPSNSGEGCYYKNTCSSFKERFCTRHNTFAMENLVSSCKKIRDTFNTPIEFVITKARFTEGNQRIETVNARVNTFKKIIENHFTSFSNRPTVTVVDSIELIFERWGKNKEKANSGFLYPIYKTVHSLLMLNPLEERDTYHSRLWRSFYGTDVEANTTFLKALTNEINRGG